MITKSSVDRDGRMMVGQARSTNKAVRSPRTVVIGRFGGRDTAGSRRTDKHERAFGLAVSDLTGRLRRDADRIPAFHLDRLVIDDDGRTAFHEDVDLLVVAVGVVMRTVPPVRLTAGDCHADFLTVEWITQRVHRAGNRFDVGVVDSRVRHQFHLS